MTVATRETYPDTMADTNGLARWAGIANAAAMLADRINGTDFVPEAMRGNAPMVCAAIMYGDELGVGPMQALAGINVIKGKPSPSSELQRALVFRAGHSLKVLKSDGNVCRVAGQRKGDREPTVIEWSLEMARAAGLVDSNPTWRRYPRAMLLARATTELCRMLFPDVVKGLSHVVDDESVAEDFDAWAASETGTEPEPAKRTQTVSRKPRTLADVGRVIQDTPLPDDGPRYAPEAMSAPESDPEWPVGVSQPPLPLMPPDAPTTAPDGAPLSSVAPTDAVPSGVAPPEPLPDVDDTEMMRDDEPQGTHTMRAIHGLFNAIGVERDERPKRLAITSTIVGRPITTSKELTRLEALAVVRVLNDATVGLLTFEPDPRQPWGIAITPREDTNQP